MPSEPPEYARFQLCDRCLRDYRALWFDEAARLQCNFIPHATIMWMDEHPDVRGIGRCAQEVCELSLFCLISARSWYWENQVIPEHLQEVWADAQALMPLWPGFRRLRITEEERDIIRGCVLSAQDFFQVFSDGGEEVETEEVVPGVERFRIRIDSGEQRPEQDDKEDERP